MLQKKSIFTLCLMLAGLLGSVGFAQTFSDPGFVSELVTTLDPYQPVGLTWAPDGRMFIWQKNGIVRIFKNGALLQTPFINISAKVNIVGDRGLLGLALDPSFATNGYVYLFYSYEPNNNPNDGSPKTGRLTRVTANPSNPDVMLAGSEVLLLGSISAAPCAAGADCIGNEGDGHCVDTLRFGPDGKLYASIGDSASYTAVDAKALRAQDLNYYNGKVLRLNTNGTAPTDNPFYDSANPNSVKSRIYAYGLRNPYRFAIHPTTGEVMIGDVGWYDYEELNRGKGANFGWPCYEGNYPQASYQSAFTQCKNLAASAVTKPFYVYSHTDTQAFGGSVIGGTHYTTTQFPSQYRSNFFFGEYVGQYINRVVFDFSNNFLSVARFASNVGAIVSLEQGPDGALYYVEIITGQVRRIRYTGAASTPVAVASGTPSSGVSPLTVNFSSAGSYDPGGSALNYLWNFGDGTPTSIAPNPQHQYSSSTSKTFTATLTVTNSQGNSASTTVTIAIGSQAPVATITSPRNGLKAKVGSTVTYTGTAYDPDSTLTDSSYSWQIVLHHNDHIHPYGTVTGKTGSFVVENHGTQFDDFSYEIILTVTDNTLLKDVKRVFVDVSKARK